MRELLRLPGYWRLASAYALNQLGWFISTIALSYLVYRRTGSILGSSGFFLCSQALPAILGPPLVGRLDRLPPRVLLPALYGGEALLYALLAWLTGRFALVPVLVLVVLDGILALAAGAIAVAARTEILKPAGLVREGGAVASLSFSAAYLLGPLLGGFVTAVGGTGGALLLNSVLFALMGLALLSRSIPARTVHEGPERRRLRAALRHVRANRPVMTLLTMQTLVYICFSISTPLEVVYTVHTLHAGSTGYGLLMAVWGGAALVGSFAYARLRHGDALILIGVAVVLGALGFTELAVAPTLAVALLGAVLIGASNGLSTVLFSVELQEIVPQSWMALAMSFNGALLLIAPGIGIAIGGLLGALVSVRFAFVVSAAASVVFAGLGLMSLAVSRPVGRGAGTEVAGASGQTVAGAEGDAEAGVRSGTPA
ncbi:MAG TPA: MFS transporter [Solirubrobacteraceae bacterium]|nr:MFS transporter [Solirubrobacteraceae bacterium]